VSGSVLFYVQHLLGIGHLRRALRIVDALACEGIEVSLVSGGEPVAALASTTARRMVQLPPIRARDASFRELVDAAGGRVDDHLWSLRRAALLEALSAAQPDAILIEAFPFGRRAFRFELDALVSAARSRRPRPLLLCSLRDIVVVPDDEKRRREIVNRVRSDFDFVLVHGDPALIPLEASFPPAAEISDRLIYTGYIGGADAPVGAGVRLSSDELTGSGEVVVSVGGGAMGGALLSTALDTRRSGFLADLKWRMLAGPNLPEPKFAALASALPQRVALERYRQDFPQILRRCRVSVSQAGYNTILDILEARAPAVVVPFAAERETEQTLRAERLACRGVLEVVHECDLSPERLARAIDRAINRPPEPIAIATGGAQRTAILIAGMIQSRSASSRKPVESLVLQRTGAMIRP
jgi:predicted glycosyltransferase